MKHSIKEVWDTLVLRVRRSSIHGSRPRGRMVTVENATIRVAFILEFESHPRISPTGEIVNLFSRKKLEKKKKPSCNDNLNDWNNIINRTKRINCWERIRIAWVGVQFEASRRHKKRLKSRKKRKARTVAVRRREKSLLCNPWFVTRDGQLNKNGLRNPSRRVQFAYNFAKKKTFLSPGFTGFTVKRKKNEKKNGNRLTWTTGSNGPVHCSSVSARLV